jgi:oligopeptide/dipeptide ABC transporter ATP-binding protein
LVEKGPTSELLQAPRHPYTLGLLEAVVDLGDEVGELRPIGGALPDPLRLSSGCTFHPRCTLATEECSLSVPPLVLVGDARPDGLQPRESACFHFDLVEAP